MNHRLKHLNIKIYGQVQGVFFRHSARKKALELGLVGFARNQPDGSVLIGVQGEESALDAFVKWCEKGSEYSRVERVETHEDKIENFRGFEII